MTRTTKQVLQDIKDIQADPLHLHEGKPLPLPLKTIARYLYILPTLQQTDELWQPLIHLPVVDLTDRDIKYRVIDADLETITKALNLYDALFWLTPRTFSYILDNQRKLFNDIAPDLRIRHFPLKLEHPRLSLKLPA